MSRRAMEVAEVMGSSRFRSAARRGGGNLGERL
jgi:hypothetical protein